MSTFNTRCPSCHSLNRVPVERITESPNCGKCQSSLLDGAPIEGTEANFSALLQSDKPVVVDFGHLGVIRVLASLLFLAMWQPSAKGEFASLRLIRKHNKTSLHISKFAAFQPLWCSKMVNVSI